MRLDKLLSNYGIGTRKEVKAYIRKGFVEVNGKVIKKDDTKVDYQKDIIIFDGEVVEILVKDEETVEYGKPLFVIN